MPRCLAFLTLLLANAAALTVKVEPRTEDCLFVEVKQNQPVTLSYQVTAGGKLDIDTLIYDPRGVIVKAWNGASDGVYHWNSQLSGNVKVCFSNNMARWTPKWVAFFLHVGHDPNAAKQEHLDPLETTIRNMEEGLEELLARNKNLRAVERLHLETIESTNSWLLYWSVSQALILLGSSLLQIRYLKRFVEVKTTI
eukprot:Sspe_Gene.77274::Locus_48272_Transcript_1_1_Confidence_1.000_Length_740::g.77274::m.77274/K20347/TMED2, EMP24; p24 family protein beta-1